MSLKKSPRRAGFFLGYSRDAVESLQNIRKPVPARVHFLSASVTAISTPESAGSTPSCLLKAAVSSDPVNMIYQDEKFDKPMIFKIYYLSCLAELYRTGRFIPQSLRYTSNYDAS